MPTFAMLVLFVSLTGEVQTEAAPFETFTECEAEKPGIVETILRANPALYAVECVPLKSAVEA